MKKQLIYMTLVFITVITIIALVYNKKISNYSYEETYEEQLVNLNEIVQLSEKGNLESDIRLEQAIANFKDKLADTQQKSTTTNAIAALWILYGLCIFFLFLVIIYVYRIILRPFNKLQAYSEEIAKGNFDVKLQYERTNYFGKFTWAFDHMRREITKARG